MAVFVAGWDGSEASDRALEVAAGFVQNGDTLVAVTIVPARLQERSFLEMLLPTVDVGAMIKPGSFTARANERLAERLAKLDTKGTVEAVVRAGDPADEILAVVEEKTADHLVVGYKSYEKHLRFDLGSIAEKLVRYAPCAVTIVRWRDAQTP